MSRPIPILLIGGWLGAGKTTLLNRLVARCQGDGVRLALVVNDFGAVNVDGRLVRRGAFAVAEVAGGCICCSDPAEITDAVTMLAAEYTPDWIVIETSGLADPVDTVNVLSMPETIERWRVARIVAVMDADLLLREAGCRALAERQVPFADVVVLNKTDLVDPIGLQDAEGYLRKLNACVPIRATLRCDLAIEELLGEPAALTRQRVGGAGARHLHTAFRTMAYHFAHPVNEPAFRELLTGLTPGVIRSKGFVRFADREGIQRFQTVDRHVDVMAWPVSETPPLVGVFIGQGLDQDRLRAALAATTAARPQRLPLHPDRP